MATWKKVIVSGSAAAFTNVINDGVAEHAAVVGGGVGANQTGVALGAGQLLIGAVGAAPAAASITTGAATDSGSLLVTTGANSLKLEVAGDTISPLNLSGSVADVPAGGETVKISADGKGFVFDAASSVLSAGLGITITSNEISSSIANSATSFGTVPTTEFSGSFTGSLVGLADNATNATNATNVNLSDNESTDENNVLVFGAGTSATGNTALESDGDLTYNPGKSRLSVPQITSSAGFKGDLTGNADTATVATNVTITDNENTDEANAIIFGAGGDIDGGNLGLESDGDLTYNPLKSRLSVPQITSSAGFKGDLDGNASTATSATTATGLGTNATGTNLVLSGNLTVQGATTEVQTVNLAVKDKLIQLASGSATAVNDVVNFSTGFVFAGARIGDYAGSRDATTNGSGSAVFVDGATQRLTVTTDDIGPTDSSLNATGTRRAHIPLVFTGSAVSAAAGQQIGNFKVDSSGDFYVYTA